MTCKDFQNLIVMDLYDELSADDQERLHTHLNQCSGCREHVSENQQLYNLLSLEEAEELKPNWDECWQKIDERVAIAERKQWSWLPIPRWGMAFAGSLVLLVIGFFLGRIVFPPTQPGQAIQTQMTNQGQQIMVNNYLEDLKPLVVDLANYTVSPTTKNGGPIEKEIINNMLMQTRLLKLYFNNQTDPNINMLLEEMEMILIDLNNIKPGDKGLIQSLQGIIKEKGIPFKIKMLQQKTDKVTKI